VTLRAAVDAAEAKIAATFRDQPAVEAAVRDTLGATYTDLGDPGRAVRQAERALDLYRAALGPDHYDTLRSMNNQAAAYYDAGQRERALPLLEELLHRSRARLGPTTRAR
jgi:tetratricopeptide (TPR) repeat protein